MGKNLSKILPFIALIATTDIGMQALFNLSGLWLLAFLAYTLLVKVINALTLSLKAFTTLGFGNIPTRGFSRYIVIVQGFIG